MAYRLPLLNYGSHACNPPPPARPPSPPAPSPQVVLTNMPADHFQEVEAQTFPGREHSEGVKVPLTRVLYIEATDFRLKVRRGNILRLTCPHPSFLATPSLLR